MKRLAKSALKQGHESATAETAEIAGVPGASRYQRMVAPASREDDGSKLDRRQFRELP